MNRVERLMEVGAWFYGASINSCRPCPAGGNAKCYPSFSTPVVLNSLNEGLIIRSSSALSMRSFPAIFSQTKCLVAQPVGIYVSHRDGTQKNNMAGLETAGKN